MIRHHTSKQPPDQSEPCGGQQFSTASNWQANANRTAFPESGDVSNFVLLGGRRPGRRLGHVAVQWETYDAARAGTANRKRRR